MEDKLTGLFAAIDAQDSTSFADFIAADGVFCFGSAPPVQGRANIKAAVAGFFGSIAGCKHVLSNTLRAADTLVCEGKVTYQRHDGRQVTLPFVNVFELEGELIAQYKIYIDIQPLYAN